MTRNNKIKVLDTNIIFDNYLAVREFDEHLIVVPDIVVHELEKHKSERSDRGYHSRKFGQLRANLAKSAPLMSGQIRVNESGGTYMESSADSFKDTIVHYAQDRSSNDFKILKVASGMQSLNPDAEVEFVTNDIYLLGTALGNGIKARVRLASTVQMDELYTGISFLSDDEVFAKLFEERGNMVRADSLFEMKGTIPIFSVDANMNDEAEEFVFKQEELKRQDLLEKLVPNQYVVFTTREELERSFLTGSTSKLASQTFRFVVDEEARRYLKPIDLKKIRELESETKINPKSLEQYCALDLTLANDISAVALYGYAGTGKTLLATASAWHQAVLSSKNEFTRLLLTKPHQNVAEEEYGFMPGDILEKVAINYASISNALEYILENQDSDDLKGDMTTQELVASGLEELLRDVQFGRKLKIRPLGFMRGINIRKNEILLGDELQNTTETTIKTLTTRVSEGAKFFLTGDPQQVDNPYGRSEANGLTHFVDSVQRTRHDVLSRHLASIKLILAERGPVAKWSIKYL